MSGGRRQPLPGPPAPVHCLSSKAFLRSAEPRRGSGESSCDRKIAFWWCPKLPHWFEETSPEQCRRNLRLSGFVAASWAEGALGQTKAPSPGPGGFDRSALEEGGPSFSP